MAKPKNKVETVVVKIATTPRVGSLLDELVAGQMHGKSRSEVAEELVRTALRPLMAEQKLTSKPPSRRRKDGSTRPAHGGDT